MRAILFAASLFWALSGAAAQQQGQQPAKPGPKSAATAKPAELTAGQIIEKSIAAAGGRAAMEKLTSTAAKGMLELPGTETLSAIEFYAKAPNKRLIVTTIENYGQVKQGCDGQTAWIQDPQRGLIELSGAELETMRREAVFNGPLKWRDLYPKVELKGMEKIGARDAYVVELTPADGKPIRQYFDAQSFLLVRQVVSLPSPQGAMDVTVDFSDYRDIGGGIKAPFRVKQRMPTGNLIITLTEMENNVKLDDAMFAKPAPEGAK